PGIFSPLTVTDFAFASTVSTMPLNTKSFFHLLSRTVIRDRWPYATAVSRQIIVTNSTTLRPYRFLFIPSLRAPNYMRLKNLASPGSQSHCRADIRRRCETGHDYWEYRWAIATAGGRLIAGEDGAAPRLVVSTDRALNGYTVGEPR